MYFEILINFVIVINNSNNHNKTRKNFCMTYFVVCKKKKNEALDGTQMLNKMQTEKW